MAGETCTAWAIGKLLCFTPTRRQAVSLQPEDHLPRFGATPPLFAPESSEQPDTQIARRTPPLRNVLQGKRCFLTDPFKTHSVKSVKVSKCQNAQLTSELLQIKIRQNLKPIYRSRKAAPTTEDSYAKTNTGSPCSFANPPTPSLGVYSNRIIGRDCDHCYFGGNAFAGTFESKRPRATHARFEQRQTNFIGQSHVLD